MNKLMATMGLIAVFGITGCDNRETGATAGEHLGKRPSRRVQILKMQLCSRC